MSFLDKKFLKKRDGTKASIKQFFSDFKGGMEKISPYQQTKLTQWGQIISGIGVIWGIVFSVIIGWTYWWMTLILIGGLIVLGTQFLGNWQKKRILKKQEDVYKMAEFEEPQEKILEVTSGLG